MVVAASSYEALVTDYALAMLAASATFQTLVGATGADATALALSAKGWIIKGIGGTPNQTDAEDDEQKAVNCLGAAFSIAPTVAHALVSSLMFPVERIGLAEFKHSGSVNIVVSAPVTAAETPNDTETRGANVMGAIRSEIEAQFGTTGKLMAGTVSADGISLEDETGARRGAFQFLLTIDWADVI